MNQQDKNEDLSLELPKTGEEILNEQLTVPADSEVQVVEPEDAEVIETNEPEPSTVAGQEQEEAKLRAQYNVPDNQPVIIIHNENNAQQTAQQEQTQQVQQTVVVKEEPKIPWLGHEKSKWVAFWLCFFFGTFGAYQYYAGNTGKGITMTILFLTMIGAPIAAIWAIVDLIKILIGSYYTKWGQPI